MAWEFRMLDWIRAHRTRILDVLMPFFTSIGNGGLVWHLLSLVLLVLAPFRAVGLCVFFSSMLASAFANLCMKPLAGRVRPWEHRPDVGLLTKKRPHGSSFPSGHATTSFGGAVGGTVGMAMAFGAVPAIWMGALAGLVALCISYSRLYLYVHFPTDVFVGILVGVLFGLFIPRGVFPMYDYLMNLR